MKLKGRFFRFLLLFVAISALVLAGYACDDNGDTGGCNDDDQTVDYDTSSDGPYTAVRDLSAGPSSDSGLFYPNGDGPFPVFLWGCGGGSEPSDYVDHMNRIASWGFIAIAEVSSGDGSELTEALDWIISQNSNRFSPLYQKVDTAKVAAGGHSMGSITTFAMADDPRLSTTIHVAGGSFDGNGPDNLRNPTAYICGEDDATGATDNATTDYRNTTVPVFFTVMQSVDHISAAREGLPAITAWLLWHLKGETNRQGDFLDPDGVFQTGMWDTQTKNW